MTVFMLAALDVRYHLETYGVENLNARTLMILREKLTKDFEPAMRFFLNFSECSIPVFIGNPANARSLSAGIPRRGRANRRCVPVIRPVL